MQMIENLEFFFNRYLFAYSDSFRLNQAETLLMLAVFLLMFAGIINGVK